MGCPRKTAAACTAVLLLLISGGDAKKADEDHLVTLARWLDVLNGDYTALDITDADGNHIAFQSNISIIPINVPGINDPISLITENTADVSRHYLARWTVDHNGIGHSQIYSVPESDVLRSFHDRGLGKAPLYLPVGAHVKRLNNCKGTYEETELALFEGSWFDCSREENGEHPLYTYFVRCGGFSYIKNGGGTSVIYNYVKQGDSYPLVPEVQKKIKDIPNPCDVSKEE